MALRAEPTILSLCAGVGGIDLGLRIAMPRSSIACYVEREAYAAACLVARMEESSLGSAPVWDCLESFDGRLWRGVVDIIVAGEPCQPFSFAGLRGGASDKRYLWPQVARVVREVEPQLVFLENVPGAIDARYEHKAELESLGYRVETGLFSAEEVGAPHGRIRLFMLANSRGVRRGGRGDGDSGGRERTPETPRPSGELAHRNGSGLSGKQGRRVFNGKRKEPGNDTDRCDNELADTEDPDGRGASGAEDTGRRHTEAGGHGGEVVGDTGGKGPPKREGESGDIGAQRKAVERASNLPLWPPRPNGDWRGVPATLEPAVRGDADGPTVRVDRLRATGNGVVPVVAALAFTTLWGRLNDG